MSSVVRLVKTFGPHNYRCTLIAHTQSAIIGGEDNIIGYMKYCSSKTYYICSSMFNQYFGKPHNICGNHHDLICFTALCHYSFGAFVVIWLLLPRCDPSCCSHITLPDHTRLTNHHTRGAKTPLPVRQRPGDERSVLSLREMIGNVVGRGRDGLIDSKTPG